MKTLVKTIAALTLAASIPFTLCSCGARSSVKLEDVVAVNVEGFDGHATVQIEVDDDAINAKINSKKAAKLYNKINGTGSGSEEENFFSQFDSYAASENLFNYFLDIETAEDYENLSNGDKVEIVVKPDSSLEEAGYTLNDIEKGLGISIDDEMEYEVSGLETAKEVKFFDSIDDYVEFVGSNGYGTASFTIPDDYVYDSEGYYFSRNSDNSLSVVKDNTSLGTIYFNIETDEDVANGYLKEGDKIKITLNGDTAIGLMENDGYIPAESSYTITVPDLGTYLTGPDEITDEELSRIRAEVTAKIAEESSEATIDGVYYATVKPEKVVGIEKNFKIVFVYTAPGFFWNFTYSIDVTCLKKTADGTFTYQIGENLVDNDGVDGLSDNWTYTAVK